MEREKGGDEVERATGVKRYREKDLLGLEKTGLKPRKSIDLIDLSDISVTSQSRRHWDRIEISKKSREKGANHATSQSHTNNHTTGQSQSPFTTTENLTSPIANTGKSKDKSRANLNTGPNTANTANLNTGAGREANAGRSQRSSGSKHGRRNHTGPTTTSPLCWTAGANTVVSDQDQEPIRIWILTCRWFLTVGILPGSWWAHHELGRGGWWFRDPVENASFMPRVLATACIHSVILPLLHSWTSFLNIVTLPCCVLGTFSIRSGLLAPVHSFATDDTRGIFLWRFFLLMTGISMILFSQMKQQASVRRTYKKEMVVAGG